MRSRLGFAVIPALLMAALMVSPVVVSAANGTGGDNAPMGVICGHVYDATSGSLVSGGAVMVLEIIVKNSYTLFKMVYDGYYEFTKIPEGVYTLRASCNGYDIMYREDVEVVRSQVTVEDFVMSRTGEVCGFAKDAVTLVPIPGAYVYLVGAPLYTSKNTTSDGGFILFPVLPGYYTLKIEKAGYAPYTHPYPVPVYEWQMTSLYSLYLTRL